MSQVTSAEVPSGSGLSVRQGINDVLAALMSLNSGSSAPPNPVPGMAWFDTSAGDIKVRNAGNTAWLLLSEMIGALEYDRAQSLTEAQKAQIRANAEVARNPEASGGSSFLYANPSTPVVMPAGGRWRYFLIRRNLSTGAMNGANAGNAAGGATVYTTVAGEDVYAHIWRIS